MKKLFSLFFALVATTALWAYDFQSGDLYYNITSRGEPYTVEVTSSGSASYSGSVTIPETVTYNGTTYSVTSIGSAAFWNCDGLMSVTIGSSVTSIGGSAFDNCSSLTSITIPNSVTTIGNYAFYWCESLTSVTIPNSVTSIGNYAFQYCSSLTSATIGNSVTSIGKSVFAYCKGLISVTIGNSVTSIGDEAFYLCSGLTSITIPNSVTSIGYGAFGGCSGLTSIVVEEGNTMYDSRENCNAIIETASNTLITGCKNTIIPNSVTSIGYEAFYKCFGLTEITIPNSVTSIGDEAFYKCSGLTEITIPNSVTSIGDDAFEGCSGLTSITIPNSVTSIGWGAFNSCSGLTSITIPNSVTSIGGYAFQYCSSLAVVNVEATTPPTLGTKAFTSSPTCNIPCGTLEVYQASDWQNFVGEFVEQCSDDSGDDGDMDKDLTILFSDRDNNQISAQTVTLRVPMAPQIAGFTFLYWLPVAEPVDDVITLQAVYESNTPTAAPEVYVNPSNPAQKLIRNGQVYILHEEKMYTISGQVVK